MFELSYITNIYVKYNSLINILLIAFISYYPLSYLVRKLFLRFSSKILAKYNTRYNKIIRESKIDFGLRHSFIAIYLFFFNDILNVVLSTRMENLFYVKDMLISLYMTISISYVILRTIDAMSAIYLIRSNPVKIPISLHLNILKILVIACTILVSISHVLNLSVTTLFASLGAMAAVLTFIFRDMAIGLVSALQLTLSDSIRINDLVSIPKYDADGTIDLITVSIIKIRNFDNTVTIIPTAALLDTPIVNWRFMFEGQGRRVKRAINIDMDSVELCTAEDFEDMKKIDTIDAMSEVTPDLFKAENNVSNIKLFRKYLQFYVEKYQPVHGSDTKFSFLVRQLQPTQHGIPIELYFFTKDTKWSIYEDIQAEIFEHILSVIPRFKLRAFQTVYFKK